MFCPRCGIESLQKRSEKEFACGCGFHYFQNVASAVMVALCWQDEVLVAVRGREPGKGLLDLPGGFVDPGEALVRELKEELGLDLGIEAPRYVGSFANVYPYDDVVYHTCDTVFMLELAHKPAVTAADDVAACEWRKLREIYPTEFAFRSTGAAIGQLQRLRG
ncbi:NUDIX domain-containing protein [Aeromonas salmonicida subsp. achromogenes]|uniref:NUDIX hydrolase n=1 Tax=Aeromonas salmonicida TaxID=645 RepID=UPI0002F97294|nr:NUDIX domain-containing protein [Aeromonas salmonicida]TMX09090.1 NUDIX domain-containing protein [Aeromonas salmonicida subsp. achromogenes]TMX10792.1 NUDIX domain-containing protein [Aeromonas salmonicida subsp. achromogenes]TMX11445.1 NUDIX domain-containing protein [Aeromonas salmonicida subsp. achromogenes]TMX18911.1 NUDIX domain-containing protein [Aeromonas salmonicida subsp. achromogenes]